MRNSFSLSKIVLLLFALVLVCCSKDDANDVAFRYGMSQFQVDFRAKETIPAPSINWPNEIGSFALKTPVQGLKIDETTGSIAIDRDLSLGENKVTVIAQSGTQTWETSLTVTSVMKYSFWVGGRNHNPDSDVVEYNSIMQLYADGTLEIELIDNPDSKGVGVWSIEDNIVQLWLCTYCSDEDPQQVPQSDEHSYFEGVMENDIFDAKISGAWYVVRFDPDSTIQYGNFIFEWD